MLTDLRADKQEAEEILAQYKYLYEGLLEENAMLQNKLKVMDSVLKKHIKYQNLFMGMFVVAIGVFAWVV